MSRTSGEESGLARTGDIVVCCLERMSKSEQMMFELLAAIASAILDCRDFANARTDIRPTHHIW